MVETLQIYKDSYKLVVMIHRSLNEMPRKDRFSIGVRMTENALEMVDHITLAYLTREKIGRLNSLDNFFKAFTRLQTFLRLCLDLSLLSLDTLATMHPLIDDISKQYNGWKCKTSRM